MIKASLASAFASVLLIGISNTASAVCLDDIAASKPDDILVDKLNGTIHDISTGLMWKQCTEGHVFSENGECTGPAVSFSLKDAEQWVKDVNAGDQGENMGHTDWRLPTLVELGGIVEQRCTNPAVNWNRFADTFSVSYWTATPYEPKPKDAWAVNFSTGEPLHRDRRFKQKLRLVRTQN